MSGNTLAAETPSHHRAIRQVEVGKAGSPPFEATVAIVGESDERVFTVCIRDVSRKAPTQQALYQSQRRQLVGSLAGGIAHHFNNILTAVICQIDLVLLDIQMPRMNRWDTMEKLHQMNPQIPVLLLSGGVSDPPGDRSALSRAAGVLHKPFANVELLRAVRDALDAPHRSR